MQHEHDPDMKGKWAFNPTISFDGVAIITAAILCSVWFGSLSKTVDQHGEILRHHDQMLQSMNAVENVMAQNIAALTTLVNERTSPIHKP